MPARRPPPLWFLVFLLAFALRLLVWRQVGQTPLGSWESWDQTDMHVYLEQAARFAAGDWLGRDVLVPDHHIFRFLARERLLGLHPASQFYQAPLFSYLLSLPLALGLDAAWWLRLFNCFAGALACSLMYGVTRRLANRRAALAAALLMAAYGPLLAIGTQLLRETVVIFLACAALGLFALAVRHPRRGRLLFAVGLLNGLLAAMHEIALPLACGLLVGLLVRPSASSSPMAPAAQRPVAWRARGLLCLLFGIAIGIFPLALRNACLGLPASPGYFGTTLTFIWANHAANESGGMAYLPPGPWLLDALDHARHSPWGPLAPVAPVAASHAAHPWAFVASLAARALALWSPGERPQNLSYAYFQHAVPLLKFTFDFRWLAPLAVAGWYAASRAARRGSSSLLVALGVFALATCGMLCLSFPVGRFRLLLLPALFPVAGLAVDQLFRAIQSRHGRRIALLGALLISVGIVQFALGRRDRALLVRSTDYIMASRIYFRQGDPQRALAELEAARQQFPDEPALVVERALLAGQWAEARGARDEALALYRGALAVDSSNPALLTRLRKLGAVP